MFISGWTISHVYKLVASMSQMDRSENNDIFSLFFNMLDSAADF